MIDLQTIFKNKRPDAEKLSGYGFCAAEGGYTKDFPIMQGQFTVKIAVAADGAVDYHVYDAQTAEEYVLARVADATGNFIGEVHAACEEILSDVAQNCFDTETFQSAQTKRVVRYIAEKYGAEPEFLWEKFPGFAAIRTKEKVWFALLGRVEKRKFGLTEGGIIEVINLKNVPEDVTARIQEHRAYPAYHMNKRCWYSVFLDDSLPDAEIFAWIDTSYLLVNS